jgi:hypothetical protein
VETVGTIDPESFDQLMTISNETLSGLVTSLNDSISELFNEYTPTYTQTEIDFYQGIANLSLGYTDESDSKKKFMESTLELMSTVLNSIFETYGFKPPENTGNTARTASQELGADFDTISVVVCTIPPITFVQPFLRATKANINSSSTSSSQLE